MVLMFAGGRSCVSDEILRLTSSGLKVKIIMIKNVEHSPLTSGHLQIGYLLAPEQAQIHVNGGYWNPPPPGNKRPLPKNTAEKMTDKMKEYETAPLSLYNTIKFATRSSQSEPRCTLRPRCTSPVIHLTCRCTLRSTPTGVLQVYRRYEEIIGRCRCTYGVQKCKVYQRYMRLVHP